MQIASATAADVEQALVCLVSAFAQDPITRFLLEPGPSYRQRLTQFFSLLMRARIALEMPVLVARDTNGILGATMGYRTAHSKWPRDLEDEWNDFESAVPGMRERLALYEEVAEKNKPPLPHYYLGVIGVDPAAHGHGIGAHLLESFREVSAADPLSSGVYLETANPANVGFYERAGFAVVGTGSLGSASLWCMFLTHEQRRRMQIRVVREACCAADDQLGPLETEFAVSSNATLGELVDQIRASRFLQFSSTHKRISGEVDGTCLVEVYASDGPSPTFHVDESSPVARVIEGGKMAFYFRHV